MNLNWKIYITLTPATSCRGIFALLLMTVRESKKLKRKKAEEIKYRVERLSVHSERT